jgi:hypothetical protein
MLTGQPALTEYQFGACKERHFFCRHCGVRPYGLGNSPRFGVFYGVSVACLDNATDAELAAAPISYVDGRADNWTTPPAETGYL